VDHGAIQSKLDAGALDPPATRRVRDAAEESRRSSLPMVRRLVLLVAVAGAILGAGSSAAAAGPPPNDTFSGAQVIPSLPFGTTEDTTQRSS
jgi:hypothetical protein